MSKIKVAEIFYSIQGEGRFMGVPSVFLRTFGCNFKCEGFGMPKGEKSNERNDIAANIQGIQKYGNLPLVHSGCDSYASWDPRFKHLSPVWNSDDLAEHIVSLLPEGRWNEEHLVITGGEPLLGWQKSYIDLLEHPKMKDLKHITFETNGTQKLRPEFRSYFNTRFKNNKKRLTFSVSPKLSVSGEKWEEAIQHKVVDSYRLMGDIYLKFVIATQDDVNEVKKAVDQYNSTVPESHYCDQAEKYYDIPKYDVYVMPCGGDEDMYNLNKGQVANIAMENGWRYSDRLQIPLFKNAWGT